MRRRSAAAVRGRLRAKQIILPESWTSSKGKQRAEYQENGSQRCPNGDTRDATHNAEAQTKQPSKTERTTALHANGRFRPGKTNRKGLRDQGATSTDRQHVDDHADRVRAEFGGRHPAHEYESKKEIRPARKGLVNNSPVNTRHGAAELWIPYSRTPGPCTFAPQAPMKVDCTTYCSQVRLISRHVRVNAQPLDGRIALRECE